jgi:DNA helicase-2/ATP-dependent DNA helicase PcrA
VVHGNLMVVGDEAQSIYAFRGASVDNILDFDQIFPAATTTILTENYRSTAPVLALANGVLASFREGIEKQLESRVGDGPVPLLVAVEDTDRQADYVVERALTLREDGVPLTAQAILARSGMQLHAIELALSRANIPYRKFGGLRLSEAAHVKDVLALLRVAVNPRDTLAWLRVLPWCENVGKTTAQRIADARFKGDTSPLSSMTRRRAPELDQIDALVGELAGMIRDPGAAFATAIDGLRPFLVRNYDDPDDRMRELESVLALSDRFDDVPRLVSELTLEPPLRSEATKSEDEELLTLSTIHSAKGLEWRSVVIVGLGDGGFPSGFALEDPAAIEEERRLLYVAVTRAKRHLVLMQPRFLSRRGGPVFSPGCQLLDDVPDLWSRVQPGWAGQRDDPTDDGELVGVSAEVEDRLARLADYFGD